MITDFVNIAELIALVMKISIRLQLTWLGWKTRMLLVCQVGIFCIEGKYYVKIQYLLMNYDINLIMLWYYANFDFKNQIVDIIIWFIDLLNTQIMVTLKLIVDWTLCKWATSRHRVSKDVITTLNVKTLRWVYVSMSIISCLTSIS